MGLFPRTRVWHGSVSSTYTFSLLLAGGVLAAPGICSRLSFVIVLTDKQNKCEIRSLNMKSIFHRCCPRPKRAAISRVLKNGGHEEFVRNSFQKMCSTYSTLVAVATKRFY